MNQGQGLALARISSNLRMKSIGQITADTVLISSVDGAVHHGRLDLIVLLAQTVWALFPHFWIPALLGSIMLNIVQLGNLAPGWDS